MSEALRLADVLQTGCNFYHESSLKFDSDLADAAQDAADVLRRLSAELEECQAQRRTAFRRIEEQDAELEKVRKDAERYRWLRNESWAGYNMSKGFPHVFTADGAGNRRMMLAEDAMDATIDAAMKGTQ